MGYVDRPAYWRLAHFQRGCGAAVPWRAISACDLCFAFLLPIVNARVTCLSHRVCILFQICFLSVKQNSCGPVISAILGTPRSKKR